VSKNIEAFHFMLCQEGIDVNAKTDNGMTALTIAVEEKQEAMVEALLLRQDIKAELTDGTNLLHAVIGMSNCSLRLVELALEHCRDHVNVKALGKVSPLAYAALAGRLDIVEYLLQIPEVDVNTTIGGKFLVFYFFSSQI
jgi:ankyrin repeat protein